MNVFFHSSAAIGIIALLADTQSATVENRKRICLRKSTIAFIFGIIVHGILDYMPHCYPLQSKLDVSLSLLIMVVTIWKARKSYKPLVMASFLGNVFPDIIDLSGGIMRRQFKWEVPLTPKVFPWHWAGYSGSLYNGDCMASNVYHSFLIMLVIAICVWKRKVIKLVFFS